MKVSQKALTRYLVEIRECENWLKSKRQSWTRDTLDNKVTKYTTYLYESEADLSQASYLIYGLQLLHCDVVKQNFLVNAKLALSGWRKQSPGQMRVPVPEEFLFDLMQYGIDINRVDVSMALLIQYDGYLRPSECLTLTRDHICEPQGRKYPRWGLIIAPSTLHQTTKTGESDDSILLGDKAHDRWVKECLRCFFELWSMNFFPDISLPSYESFCRQACEKLGYKCACVMPHIIRHSSASNDVYHGRRTLAEVQKRGRWAAKKSVSRYEKHAFLLAQWRQVCPSRRQAVEA